MSVRLPKDPSEKMPALNKTNSERIHTHHNRYLDAVNETDDLRMMVHDVIGTSSESPKITTSDSIKREKSLSNTLEERFACRKRSKSLPLTKIELEKYGAFDRLLLKVNIFTNKLFSDLSEEEQPQSQSRSEKKRTMPKEFRPNYEIACD